MISTTKVQIYNILGWDLAIARYQPRPCGQQGGLRLHLFFGKIFVIGIFGEFFKKQFWWKYFFNNIFGATYFENIFGENIFGAIFFENIFWWKYFFQEYFWRKIFWNKYFFGKGTSLSLPCPCPTISTPYIQLPPLLLEVEGGGTKQTNSRTGRSNGCSFYIYRYLFDWDLFLVTKF